MKLVMCTFQPKVIGQRYVGLEFDTHGDPRPEQAFIVVAESDHEGWKEALRAFGHEPDAYFDAFPAPYYYEIVTD